MILFQIAEISNLQKLELYKTKLDKSQDCVLKILKHNKCLLYEDIKFFPVLWV
jgi:hypothetical protein